MIQDGSIADTPGSAGDCDYVPGLVVGLTKK